MIYLMLACFHPFLLHHGFYLFLLLYTRVWKKVSKLLKIFFWKKRVNGARKILKERVAQAVARLNTTRMVGASRPTQDTRS